MAAAASIVVALVVVTVSQVVMTPSAGPIGRVARIEGTLSIGGIDESSSAVGAELHSGDIVRTGGTGGAAFALAGGISLRLQPDAELEFSAADALTLVDGTIYVDSDLAATNDSLSISTPFGLVTDVGTRFELASDATALRVRVRGGLVRLSQSNLVDDLDGGAGDEFRVSIGGTVERRLRAPTDPAWAWVEALAVAPVSGFSSIRDCFEWIARETGREIRFDSTSTEIQAELRDLNGSPDGLLPMDLLDFVQRVSDFDYEIQADGSILISRK
jgi:hypothetical protein